MALDGKEPVTVVPFDAHDKVVRDSSGYEHQEYPKAVDHVQKDDAPKGHMEPVIAKDADHEAELAEKAEE